MSRTPGGGPAKVYHSKRCRRCGTTARYVSSANCVACKRAYGIIYNSKRRKAVGESSV